MILIGILSGLLLLITWVLTARFQIIANTLTKNYYLGLKNIIGLQLITTQDQYALRIQIFFAQIKLRRFQKYFSSEQKNDTDKTEPLSNKIRSRLKLVKSVIRSLKIKRFYANIDTGNYPLNAQLIPLAQLIDQTNASIRINFNNTNNLQCHIETRIIRILWNIIKTY